MTAPVVGSVAVEVLADAKALAKSLKKEVESAFKDLDVGKAIQDSVGRTKIKLPVEPEVDTSGLGEKVRRTRVPKVPVELDPVLAAFQAEVKRQTAALARTVNAKIPVSADTTGLRAELGAEIAAVQRQLKAKIGTEPGSAAEYALKLRAAVDAASAKVKAKIQVDPDTKGNGFLTGIANLVKGAAKALPNFGGISNTVDNLGGAIQKAAGSSAQLGTGLAGAASSAAGPIGIVIGLLVTAAGAMAGLGIAATLVVPAITAVAGAAAAIPAAIVGAGAAFGTLALGFRGISEAFKPKTGGGGGGGGEDAASRARRIAAAERGVESARRGIASASRAVQSAERGLADAEQGVVDAQKRAAQAQLAVNKARVDAKEDIEDLNRSLAGAKLSEEDAALGVTEALRALNEAKLTGNLPDIQRADLAYRQAQQTLAEAADTADDLQKSTDTANKAGVEGSDKVVSALQDQQDAIRGVKDAQNGVVDAQNAVLSANDGLKASYDGLLSAQDSLAESQKKAAAGAAAAAAKLIPLAPAAQKFVDAIKALKPAFEDLRLDVQQRLFQGLDQTVTNLGRAWIPALKTTLGRYADTFNQFFKSLGTSITTPKFIADIQAGAEGARQGLAKIGDSITTSLVPAFGTLSRAAGPFLAQLGQELATIVTRFSDWVLQGEKSGKLSDFFDRAVVALHSIFTTGTLVTKIIGDLFSILVGAQAKTGKTPIDSFNNALQKLDDYLSNPANQQQIRDFIAQAAATLSSLGDKIRKIDNILDKLGLGDADTANAKAKAGSVGSDIGSLLFAGLIAGLGEAVKKSAVFFIDNLLIGPVIGLVKKGFGINSPSTVFAEIGVDLIRGLILGIGAALGALASRVAGIRATVVNAFSTAGSLLVNAGRNVVVGLANGIVSLYGTLASRAAGLRTTVTNALSNAGSLLVNAGKNIVIGLINGISSKVSALGSFLGQIGSFIQAHKGPIEKDRVLLVGAGQAIMGGLIAGIDDKKAALVAQLSDVSGLIAGTSMPALASDLGAVSGSLSKSNTLTAQWAQGATGDKVLDAFRELIKFSYSGDVDAALSTG